MDRHAAPRHRDRRTAAHLSDERLRLRLERTVELDAARLELFEWPGRGGPLLHIGDPLSPSLELVTSIARSRAPATRVISLVPRPDAMYQVGVADVMGVCDQFGFSRIELIGEGLGAVIALLFSAWNADRVARLTLLSASYKGTGQSLFARSLRDCPPAWPSVRRQIACPIEERT